jgi:type III restriction enzyme
LNRKTATGVARVLIGEKREGDDGPGGTGGVEGRRVLVSPVDMEANLSLADSVWVAFDLLLSETLLRKTAADPSRG